MRLWVVIVPPRRAVIDRVLLFAAAEAEQAEALAGAFYRGNRTTPERYRFSARPITEIGGPAEAR
ncbi:MAG: hypothetical protein IT306_10250 [Chloroflexi bacterium]|nr:hypothetical protein [Chloroflexota bacterium]